MSLSKNIYWNSLAKIPAHIISFFISIMVARLLTPKDYGLVAIAMMIIGYANIFTSFGITEAIIQKKITSKEKINSIFIFNISISLFFFVLFSYFSKNISTFFKEPELDRIVAICSFIFLITSFESIASSILRRNLKFKEYSLIQIFKLLSSSVLTIILATLGYGYWSLIYGQIVPSLIFAMIFCWQSKWFPTVNVDFSGFTVLFKFGFWMTAKSSLNFFNDHVDKFLIGKYIGTGGLGVYDMSLSLTKRPYNLLNLNINSVMFSEFCRIQNDKEYLKDRYLSALTLISLISFPMYAGLIAVSSHFIEVFLGEKWGEMKSVLPIIASAFFFKSLAGIVSSLNISIGEYKKHTINLIYSSIAFLVLCYALFSYGVVGISIAFLVNSIFYLILTIRVSFTYLSIKYSDVILSTIYPLIYSTVMFLVVLLFSKAFLFGKTIFNCFSLVTIGFIIYSVLVITSGDKTVKRIIDKIKSDINIKLKFL